MKFKVTLVFASLALLIANASWAGDTAYYDIEEISVDADGASYGPYPVAISEDSEYIATYSYKASLSANIDIGLPYTFNRDCQYDDILCELEFYGSETEGDLSYLNAYQAWRNAQTYVYRHGNSYTSYMFANTLLDGTDTAASPYWSDSSDGDEQSSDVKITDVTDEIDITSVASSSDRFVVGYASDPYTVLTRDFVRRAYIESESGNTVTQLMPEFTDNGGFSSAYKLQQVTYTDGTEKTLVVGSASRSYPADDADYFDYCYNSDESDDRYDMNDLVYCPGFDTQAWAWDITDFTEGTALDGFALATTWLEDNTENQDSLTFSANAADINASGIAVGTSTFSYSSSSAEGGRQRAIIMTPTSAGVYSAPVELTAATDDIDDQDDYIYNTWAVTISDDGIITGNREYNTSKASNLPTEFFVYDNTTSEIKFPLEDLKVATTKQRLANDSYYVAKTGANSRIFDANEDGWIVGEVDDYDQIDPVYGGSPRRQAAFLYKNSSEKAWLISDLICSKTDDVVTSPRYRIYSARTINDAGVVLVEAYKYDTDDDYTDEKNATQVALKLTPNAAVSSPNDSPNCWQSSLLDVEEESYERSGGATLWFMLLVLPLVFIRRFKY